MLSLHVLLFFTLGAFTMAAPVMSAPVSLHPRGTQMSRITIISGIIGRRTAGYWGSPVSEHFFLASYVPWTHALIASPGRRVSQYDTCQPSWGSGAYVPVHGSLSAVFDGLRVWKRILNKDIALHTVRDELRFENLDI